MKVINFKELSRITDSEGLSSELKSKIDSIIPVLSKSLLSQVKSVAAFGDPSAPIVTAGPVSKSWNVLCKAYDNWDLLDFDYCNEEGYFRAFLEEDEDWTDTFDNEKELRDRIKEMFPDKGKYLVIYKDDSEGPIVEAYAMTTEELIAHLVEEDQLIFALAAVDLGIDSKDLTYVYSDSDEELEKLGLGNVDSESFYEKVRNYKPFIEEIKAYLRNKLNWTPILEFDR